MIVLIHQIIYSNVIQSTTMPHNYRIKTNIMVCFKKTKRLFQTVNLASIEQRKCGFTNVLGQVSMWNNQCSL